MSVPETTIVVHGTFLPLGRGYTATFKPDSESPQLTELAAKGPIQSSFEQDESPAVTGIFPNNGITGKLSLKEGAWEMVLDKPGRRGQLTPGKKPLPGFYVYCVGLVQNGGDTRAPPTVKKGRSFMKQPTQDKKGRGFAKTKKPKVLLCSYSKSSVKLCTKIWKNA